jgi:hypothetical protein
MGSKFLTNYIALADGEKDPRNLMVAFAIARVIGIEFDIKQHVEVRADSSFYPARSQMDFLAELLQHRILLLPHHFQTASGRSLWHYR